MKRLFIIGLVYISLLVAHNGFIGISSIKEGPFYWDEITQLFSPGFMFKVNDLSYKGYIYPAHYEWKFLYIFGFRILLCTEKTLVIDIRNENNEKVVYTKFRTKCTK